MLLIGGWEGYAAAIALHKNKEKYPEFNIPIICVPATVSNNVPGTDVSIGSDTALNCIVEVSLIILYQHSIDHYH